MRYRPPTWKEALRAIGCTEKLPPAFRRALEPGTDFEPVPRPMPGDWLAEHSEAGQTYGEFAGAGGNRPDAARNRIYLQPLGRFPDGESPPLELLELCAEAFFTLAVTTLPPVAVENRRFRRRSKPYSRVSQVLTTDVLMFLTAMMPDDAICLLAVTMEDLYPHPSWNFVFGQASLRDKVGVFSFARYDPAFYGRKRGHDYPHILLRRSCKVLIHETAHMFALSHCIFFRCVLNGSNHLNESDARPLFFCPVCLRKLQASIGFDVVRRYGRILEFCTRAHFESDIPWISRRFERIVHDVQ